MAVNNYASSKEQLFYRILDTVKTFVSDFQKKDRLEFLYEADIQANLSYELAKAIGNLNVTFYSDDLSTEAEKLSLITREYPVASESSRGRFDIACINPEMIEQYFKWRLEINKNKPIGINTICWELPLLVGIEIKYSIIGNEGGISGIQKDLEKLKSYNDYYKKRYNRDDRLTFTKDFQYLALQFFQDEDRFDELIEEEYEKFQQVNEINHFDCVYLVGKKRIFKNQVSEK